MLGPLSPADARELIRFCQAGRLYEVEACIRSGRSLTVPDDAKRTPLEVALRTGFHSLVELLLRHEAMRHVIDRESRSRTRQAAASMAT